MPHDHTRSTGTPCLQAGENVIDTTTATEAEPQRRLPSGLSPSSINSYRQCARLWKFAKVDRLPTTSGMGAVLGTHVHRVLELVMQNPAADRTVDAALAIHAQVIDKIHDAYVSVLFEDVWPHPRDDDTGLLAELLDVGWNLDEFAEAALEGIEGFFDLTTPQAVNVHGTEQALQAVWETSHGPVPVRGIADRLDRLPDHLANALLVVDYKTGRTQDARFGKYVEGLGKVMDHEIQMLMYAAMVESETGELPSRALLLYVSKAKAHWVEVTPERVAAVRELAGKIWADANARFDDDSYEPTTSALCGWCDFVTMCPEGEEKVRRMADKGIWPADDESQRIRGGIKDTAPALEQLELVP